MLTNLLYHSNYRLLGLVGQGQFGRVYCASHRRTGRLVALKELNRDRFSTRNFLRELRFLLSLQHPNIVTCQALEHTATGRCLVMDYCEGGTLRDLLSDDMQLHPLQGLSLITQILAGLDHAHQRGIVHCDIKPENILLGATATGWTARITDFGIARLSQELSTEGFGNTGSPAYMAPERFYGQHSPASDLYAVGILLFEALAGYRPFSGLPGDLMTAHLNQALVLPDIIPNAIGSIIRTALQKLPARRFRSAVEMLSALQNAIAECEQYLMQGWSPNILQHSSATRVIVPFRHDYQESLQAPVRQMAALQDNSATIAHPLYRVFSNQIGYQWFSEPELFNKTAFAAGSEIKNGSDLSSFPLTTIRLPEPALQLTICDQACFVATQQAVYRLALAALQTDLVQHQQPNQDALIPQQAALQLIATLKQDAVLTIEPGGRWLATATPSLDKTQSQLNIWNLQSSPPFKPAITLSIAPCLQLLAIDARHGVALSPITDSSANACIVGTQIELFTRRGTIIGCISLPIPLRHLSSTQTPYRLLALEPGHPNSLILLDLKPLRIKRIGLSITPKFLASTNWGYLVMDGAGQIALINRMGQEIGQIDGPTNPTAMALLNSYQVAIATWNGTEGTLSIVDLRHLDLDIVF
ncbi:serine/threonine protein kinase [Phormidium sp. CLA17]|nr:serine/threonine protein kinase [Leptolyngbya sp. Cla-17]